MKTKAEDLHSTLLKSLEELSRRQCVLVLQKKLVVFRDKFQMTSDTSDAEVVDTNRRKTKKPVESKGQNKSNIKKMTNGREQKIRERK